MGTGPRRWLAPLGAIAGLCASLLTGCGAAPQPVAAASFVSPAVLPLRTAFASPGPATAPAPMPSPVVATSAVPSAVATRPPPPPSAAPAPVLVHTFAWWDHPQRFNSRSLTAVTLPTTLTSARRCTWSDLESTPEIGAAGGTVYAGVSLHNVGGSACELRGAPEVQLLDDRGVVWQSNDPAAAGPPVTTVVLTPNSWARSVGWPVGASCGGQGVTTRIALRLPDEVAVRMLPVRLGRPAMPQCVSEPENDPRPHPGRLSVEPIQPIVASTTGGTFLLLMGLSPALDVPATVRRGSTLRYRLVVSDPVGEVNSSGIGGDQVCPLYQQQLANVVGDYELTCSLWVPLEAGQAVDYRMELRVPADAPLGPTTLRWQFLEPALPALTAPVTIVR